MVQALHGAGLRVGMDVVYNHTTASGQNDLGARQGGARLLPPAQRQRRHRALHLLREHCHREPDDGQADDRLGRHLDAGLPHQLVPLRHHGPPPARGDGGTEGPRQGRRRPRGADVGEGWNFGEVANGARFVQAEMLSLNGSGIGTSTR
jgi:pullulanase